MSETGAAASTARWSAPGSACTRRREEPPAAAPPPRRPRGSGPSSSGPARPAWPWASQLAAAGIDYTIYEKAETVGGTWWHNRYPGCGVDTPSHLYCVLVLRVRLAGLLLAARHVARLLRVGGHRSRGAAAHPVPHRGRRRPLRRAVPGVGRRRPRGRRRRRAPPRRRPRSAPSARSAVPCVPNLPGWTRSRDRPCHTARWPEGFDVTGRARRRHRQRGQRHAARAGDRRRRRARDGVPALDAVGGAVREVPAARAGGDPLADRHRAAVPAVVPPAPGLELQRQEPPRPATRPGVGPPRAVDEQSSTTTTGSTSPSTSAPRSASATTCWPTYCRRTRRSASAC